MDPLPSSMASMIEAIKSANGRVLGDPRVEEVLLKVDRSKYCPYGDPFLDIAHPIGYGANIESPTSQSIALEALKGNLVDGAKVLDIGSGSGYFTACMAHMVGPSGVVYAIEHIEELAKQSEDNIRRDCSELLDSGRVKIVHADGRNGLPDEAPFDAIHVGGQLDEVPDHLIRQLKEGGRMVVPVPTKWKCFEDGDVLKCVEKLSDGATRDWNLTDSHNSPRLRDAQQQLSSQIDRCPGYKRYNPEESSAASMVRKLKYKILEDPRVESAMLKVDRAHYCPSRKPYVDEPFSLGYCSAIPSPSLQAYILGILKDKLVDGAKVLDIGSGSGHLAACMAHLVGPSGVVCGVEHIEELVKRSENNIRRDCSDLLDFGRVKMIHADGRIGLPDEAPFDVIHVGSMIEREMDLVGRQFKTKPDVLIEPVIEELLKQLKEGGQMIFPSSNFKFETIEKLEDSSTRRTQLDRDVPLYLRHLEDESRIRSYVLESHQKDCSSVAAMIEAIKSCTTLKDPRVEKVLLTVDRSKYCPYRNPFDEESFAIGYGANIESPNSQSIALEALKGNLVDGAKVLDIGSGSGYFTACMAHMVGPSGVVYAIEHIEELAKQSEDNIRRDCSELLDSGRVEIVHADGRNGLPDEAPFDAIYVGGAVEEIPDHLIGQLKEGGRLIIPIVSRYLSGKCPVHILRCVEKLRGGATQFWTLRSCRREPLGDAKSQLASETTPLFLKNRWDPTKSNATSMVEELKSSNRVYLEDPRVESAMLKVDRAHYCPADDDPYSSYSIDYEYGTEIVSPTALAYALEALKDKLVDGAKVLDIGSGSGYSTACLAHMVGPSGVVYGVEHIEELVEDSRDNIRRDYAELIDSGRVKIIHADGRFGLPEEAPFDVIHVRASVRKLPDLFVSQLKEEGRILISINDDSYYIDKLKDGSVTRNKLGHPCYFGRLTDRSTQIGGCMI